jgi:hypothetical protein
LHSSVMDTTQATQISYQLLRLTLEAVLSNRPLRPLEKIFPTLDSQDLYILISNLAYAKEKPQVLDYAMYVVSPDGAERLAGENGFAPLPSTMYAEYYSQLEALK